MCGIIGYIGKEKKALEVLINGLEHLEYRGYDSAGIAYIYNNKLIIKEWLHTDLPLPVVPAIKP